MSRIGRNPIVIPEKVTVDLNADNLVTVTGPLGTLKQEVAKCITVNIEEGQVALTRSNDTKDVKAKHGLYRALINNMVTGVVKGYEKILQIKGVGYKLQKNGNKMIMNIGFSHPVEVLDTEGVKTEVISNTEIKISGIDKQKVGQIAQKIKALRPVEPYHGYGIRYKDERVILKQGKKSGKK